MNNNTTAVIYPTYTDDSTRVPVILLYSVLAVICMFANSLVCYVIATRKTTDGSLKYYVFSLAITDILVGAACIPVFLAKEYIWHAKWDLLESFSTGFDIFLGACSIMHLCVMAFDRLMAVTKPILHRTTLRQRKTALSLLSIPWLFGVVSTIVPFTQGSKDFEYYSSLVITYLIPLPCVFILICYVIIYRSIWKRNSHSQRDTMKLYRINQRQMTKTLLCVIIVFVICWIPFVVYYCLPSSYHEAISTTANTWFYYTAKALAYTNSICNSIIYALLNPLFRHGMKSVLKECFSRHRCNQKTRDEQIQESRQSYYSSTLYTL